LLKVNVLRVQLQQSESVVNDMMVGEGC
jgi:hypothetical protein